MRLAQKRSAKKPPVAADAPGDSLPVEADQRANPGGAGEARRLEDRTSGGGVKTFALYN